MEETTREASDSAGMKKCLQDILYTLKSYAYGNKIDPNVHEWMIGRIEDTLCPKKKLSWMDEALGSFLPVVEWPIQVLRVSEEDGWGSHPDHDKAVQKIYDSMFVPKEVILGNTKQWDTVLNDIGMPKFDIQIQQDDVDTPTIVKNHAGEKD